MSDTADLAYFVWLCDEITARLAARSQDPFPVDMIRGLLEEANQRSRKLWGDPVAEVHETLAGCWIKIMVPDTGEVQYPLWTLERVQPDEETATVVDDEGKPKARLQSPVLRPTDSENGAAARRELLYALECWSRRANRPHTEPPPAVGS